MSDYKQTEHEGKKVMDVMELYDKYVREEVIVVSSDKDAIQDCLIEQK